MNENLVKEMLNNIKIKSNEVIINKEYFEKKLIPELEGALRQIESLENENNFLKKIVKSII